MARSALSVAALTVVALAAGGCDRFARPWPFRTGPSSVTVKVPPPLTPAPGFAFGTQRTPAKTELR